MKFQIFISCKDVITTWSLKHNSYTGSYLGRLFPYIISVHNGSTRGRFEQSCKNVNQCIFSRTVRSKKSKHFIIKYFEVKIIYSNQVFILFNKIPDIYQKLILQLR